jgi:hypothetical protein
LTYDGASQLELNGSVVFEANNARVYRRSAARERDRFAVTWRDAAGVTKGKSVSLEFGLSCESDEVLFVAPNVSSVTSGAAVATPFEATDPANFGPAGRLVTARGSAAVVGNAILTQAWSSGVAAEETARNSASAPNTAQLLPGQTSRPLLGGVWDPLVVLAPGESAMGYGLLIALNPADVPGIGFGPSGTLLVDPGSLIITLISSGPQIQVPLPDGCPLAGIGFATQGGYFRTSPFPDGLQFTNAIDIVLGNE